MWPIQGRSLASLCKIRRALLTWHKAIMSLERKRSARARQSSPASCLSTPGVLSLPFFLLRDLGEEHTVVRSVGDIKKWPVKTCLVFTKKTQKTNKKKEKGMTCMLMNSANFCNVFWAKNQGNVALCLSEHFYQFFIVKSKYVKVLSAKFPWVSSVQGLKLMGQKSSNFGFKGLFKYTSCVLCTLDGTLIVKLLTSKMSLCGQFF